MHRVRRTPACSPATAPSSTTSCGRGCSTPASCAAPSPGPASRGIDASAALALRRACTRCSPPPTSTRASTSSGTRRWARTSPTRPRPPLAEGEVRFVGDPVALVVADDRYVAEDAADSSTSTTTRCRRSSTTSPRRTPTSSCTTATRATSPAASRGRRPRRLAAASTRRAHVVRARRSTSRPTRAVPMETRGHRRRVVRRGELTIWAATQAPHEVRLFCVAAARPRRAPGAGHHARHRRRVRPEGRAAARGHVPACSRPRKVPAAAEVDRGPPREPDGGRAGRATSTATCRMAFDADGAILAADIDHVQDVGAYPTPWPVGTSAAVGMLFPGPYRVADGHFGAPRRCSPTPSGAPPTAGRGSSSPSPARCCSTSPPAASASTRSSCAAATCCAATSCRTPTPTACPTTDIIAARDASSRRSSDARLRRLPRASRPRPAPQGRYLGVGTCSYVEPTTTGMAFYGTEGATIRIEPSGQGQRLRRRRLDAATASRPTVVQLTADALGVDIEDVRHHPGRHRGHPLRRRHRRQPQRVDDRRRDRARPRRRCASGSSRSPPTSSRPRPTTSSSPTAGPASGARPTAGLSLAEIADIAYFDPAPAARACPPGLEASGRYRAQAPDDLGQRHPRVHLRGRRRHRRGARCCATSSARTAGR